MKRFYLVFTFFLAAPWSLRAELGPNEMASLSPNLRTALQRTQPLSHPRGGRLPLWVLPISGQLASVKDGVAAEALRELNRRGLAYTVDWHPNRVTESIEEGLRIGRMQKEMGVRVGVNANACLYSFFDGSDERLHRDASGTLFAEHSFGPALGCPFTLRDRYPAMKERLASFLRAYRRAGVDVDFIFADWEIDGPIEWNGAWASSKRCERCRDRIPQIDDFRAFQRALRHLRSEMQRVVFGDLVRSYFPKALVGNYGVYPHEGHRYWYDYFEEETEGAPFRLDQRAKYREWYPEFAETGYSFAMPVVYTWYRTYQWYDFESSDYRWFYNMLLSGSSVGKTTSPEVPIIPFVHWHTTAPPENPDPSVQQFSRERYQELLWHLLLRGHDTYFLWCLSEELGTELELVHEVYRESLAYASYLNEGEPLFFEVPDQPEVVISGMRQGDRVLLLRTDFREDRGTVSLKLNAAEQLSVPRQPGLQERVVEAVIRPDGLLKQGGTTRFPIGIYELPGEESELRAMVEAGFNLFRCGNRSDLDRVARYGAMGWTSIPVQNGASESVRAQVKSMAGHPALVVWEGPDEIIWTYTAYSFLERVAGFTRDDWNAQIPKAVNYARDQSRIINPSIHRGIQLIRELDPNQLPFWINEAADSDVAYARETIDSVDIVGCDYYAVRSRGTDLTSVGRLVDRWDQIGYQRPVWMVLQGFSWHAIRPERAFLYPSFQQSRFMAYDSIVHGGKGVFYWGTNTIDDPGFRESLYALASELGALESMLVAEAIPGASVRVIGDLFDPPGKGVRLLITRRHSDWMVILVNEDGERHLGVDVSGLEALNGRTLYQLYHSERQTIERGGFATRMQGYEVKVYCTNPIYQSSRVAGRHYVSPERQ